MIETGRTYENPRSGGRARVLEHWRDTGNARFVWERTMPPGTGKAAAHVHLDYDQCFEVVSGTARLTIEGEERSLSAGESVEIERGTTHQDAWNEGPEELTWRMTIEPVPRFIEVYAETWFDGFTRGALNDQDEMPILQIMRIIRETNAQSFAATPPIPIQKATLPLAAVIARMRGYEVEG
jgi:mannose-6-phosphate isomerase-like protein (cupin superfamily)